MSNREAVGRYGLFCLQAGAQPRVLVFTLLGDEGLLCDFRAAFLDFWAVDAYAPSKAAFKPHRCGHWSRQHGITCAQSSQQAGGTWLRFLYCKSVNWDPGGSEVKGTQRDLCESKKRVQQAKVPERHQQLSAVTHWYPRAGRGRGREFIVGCSNFPS